MMKKTIFAGLSAFALLSGAACSKGNTSPSSSPGYMFVLNVSPDAPSLDLYANGSILVAGLNYLTGSASYTSLAGGAYNLQVTKSGAGINYQSGTLNLNSGVYVSFFMLDTINALKVSAVIDDLTPPTGDSAKIRFFDFGHDAPKMNIYTGSGTEIYAARAFNDQDSVDNYQHFITVPTGTTDVYANAVGKDSVIAKYTGAQLLAGKIYTFFASGYYTPGLIINSAPAPALTMNILKNL